MLKASAALAIIYATSYISASIHSPNLQKRWNNESENFGLHDAAVARGKLYFGTASSNHKYEGDAPYYKQLNNTSDFGQLVPETIVKWKFIELERDVFTFEKADEFVDLAVANGQLLHCPLASFPSRLGKCYAWDVVNEAVFENGTYRTSVFHNTIGSAYIPITFAAAAPADADAKLYYNDFAIELPNPKSAATKEIVKLIQSYGVKIDGVGLQGHYDLSGMPPEAHFELGSMPTYDDMVTVMEEYVELGVEVAITELDVSVLTPSNPTSLEKQAEVYYNITAACLTIEKCVGITVWEWTDK